MTTNNNTMTKKTPLGSSPVSAVGIVFVLEMSENTDWEIWLVLL